MKGHSHSVLRPLNSQFVQRPRARNIFAALVDVFSSVRPPHNASRVPGATAAAYSIWLLCLTNFLRTHYPAYVRWPVATVARPLCSTHSVTLWPDAQAAARWAPHYIVQIPRWIFIREIFVQRSLRLHLNSSLPSEMDEYVHPEEKTLPNVNCELDATRIPLSILLLLIVKFRWHLLERSLPGVAVSFFLFCRFYRPFLELQSQWLPTR